MLRSKIIDEKLLSRSDISRAGNHDTAEAPNFEGEEMKAKLFTPRDAAQILGVSYPALKQWVYKRKLRTIKTPGGHHRIPQSEIDRLLHRAQKKPGPELRTSFRRISGRNQLVGRIVDVRTSGL